MSNERITPELTARACASPVERIVREQHVKLTTIESYEIQAFAFRVMTGHMAPGKDASPLSYPAPYEERSAAWDEWRKEHASCIRAMQRGFEAVIDRDDEHAETATPKENE